MLSDGTTEDLLARFAVGRPTPGAGSAAALQGALAASLLEAVCHRLIRPAGAAAQRATDDALRERAAVLLADCRALGSRLRAAVAGDAAAFDRFWSCRREVLALRQSGGEEAAARARMAAALHVATTVPLAIAADCAALAAIGLELWDRGPRGARGEAGAAVLAAVAGGEAAAFAAALNLGPPSAEGGLQAEVASLRSRIADSRREIESRLDAAVTAP